MGLHCDVPGADLRPRRATTVPVADVPDADEAQVDDDMAHGSSALVGMIRMQIGLGVACRQQFAESVAFAAAAQGSRRRDAPQRTFATATTTAMGGEKVRADAAPSRESHSTLSSDGPALSRRHHDMTRSWRWPALEK
ncbi:predicted protein [Verticillium alfalfae VaMs.102]|uniref:Predicted protein n=1 Tax=Verticillium alfalfae (strain VaMs.102 / ATCC MYA-4576 / FGSC 10136) TaxID=526221 RepID=C9SQU8_VERA1|nr:predicted protein [Verticillium alfalfae VaMs.102]EEY21223.1 predicted protein [Verticillium alfalfae VaMs.102]